MELLIMLGLVCGGGVLEFALHRTAARRAARTRAARSVRASLAPERSRGERLLGAAGVALLGCAGGIALTWRVAGPPAPLACAVWAALACATTLIGYALMAPNSAPALRLIRNRADRGA